MFRDLLQEFVAGIAALSEFAIFAGCLEKIEEQEEKSSKREKAAGRKNKCVVKARIKMLEKPRSQDKKHNLHWRLHY